jgi:aspartyl-tRNA(Asn)/glutamyl-tRNA(Gln) amidotransferase subunit C
MSLDAATVTWVAHLARLDLSDAELDLMTRQLRSIVEYVDLLQQLDTSNVEPMAHALTVHNVFREDEPAPSLPIEEALANAPDRRRDARGEQFYGVPAVLD